MCCIQLCHRAVICTDWKINYQSHTKVPEKHTRVHARPQSHTHTQTNHNKSAIHLFYAKRTHTQTHIMISLNAPRHTQRSDTMTPPHTHACSPPQHLLFKTPRCTSNQPCVRVCPCACTCVSVCVIRLEELWCCLRHKDMEIYADIDLSS